MPVFLIIFFSCLLQSTLYRSYILRNFKSFPYFFSFPRWYSCFYPFLSSVISNPFTGFKFSLIFLVVRIHRLHFQSFHRFSPFLSFLQWSQVLSLAFTFLFSHSTFYRVLVIFSNSVFSQVFSFPFLSLVISSSFTDFHFPLSPLNQHSIEFFFLSFLIQSLFTGFWFSFPFLRYGKLLLQFFSIFSFFFLSYQHHTDLLPLPIFLISCLGRRGSPVVLLFCGGSTFVKWLANALRKVFVAPCCTLLLFCKRQ